MQVMVVIPSFILWVYQSYPAKDIDFCGKGDIVTLRLMPHTDLMNEWDYLFLPQRVKAMALNYALSILKFAEKLDSVKFLEKSKIILVEGPPICGKRSLCRALGNKLAIRHATKYLGVQFVEIKCYQLSLLPKPMSAFEEILKQIEELFSIRNILVVVFLHQAGFLFEKSSDYSLQYDSKLLNVLTKLDILLKKKKNILILASCRNRCNIENKLLDRCAAIIKLNYPNQVCAYKVLITGLRSLLKCGFVINPKNIHVPQVMEVYNVQSNQNLLSKRVQEMLELHSELLEVDKVLWLAAECLTSFSAGEIQKLLSEVNGHFSYCEIIAIESYISKILELSYAKNVAKCLGRILMD